MSSMKVNHRPVTTHPQAKHEAASKQAHAKHGPRTGSVTQITAQTFSQGLSSFLGGAGSFSHTLPPMPTPSATQQADLNLLKARFEAQANPGLASDANYLKAAHADLDARFKANPNDPRLLELDALVRGLSTKVTQEATRQVDNALNTWFESGATRADDVTLYRQVSQAESALRESAPNGSEMEFVKALRSYLQGQLFPMPLRVTV